MAWDTVIGLEVHAQLKTKSKLFSAAATTFGAKPNSQTSFIDAGLPGVLPVLNQAAVHMAIQFGLAIQAKINNHCYFERKNYFYPDLPKGYQISQYQAPIVSHGHLDIELSDGREKKIEIVRAHLEEDAGKSLHDVHQTYSGIDLNRAGTPLLEIVTSPCLSSSEEVVAYLKKLHQLVRFLNICDGNMQEGSFRCDVNISLKPQGSKQLGVRTELKNLNSFRFIEKAIAYEQARHQDLLAAGQTIYQETRLYNPDTNTTHTLRSKENENDYRYFPDPDLLPIHIDENTIEQLKHTMPLLPEQIKDHYEKTKVLSSEDINFLLTTPATYQFYEQVKANSIADEKTITNWLKGVYSAALNETNQSLENPPIPASLFATLLDKITKKVISAKIAKDIFAKLWAGETDVEAIIKREDYGQSIDNNALEQIVRDVIEKNPQQVADYRAGKEKLLAFFVGQIMKQTKGQANPEQINLLLKQYLN